MINILGGRSKAEFDDTCRKIKQNGLEQRPFRLIVLAIKINHLLCRCVPKQL